MVARVPPPPAAQHRALSAPQQARWRRRGRSPASPAPWPWRSSGPSPATSPTSRRSSASASSVSVVPSAPPATECLKGTEQAPTYLPPEPRCHFPAWSQEGVPGTQRPGAGRAKPQPWVIEPPPAPSGAAQAGTHQQRRPQDPLPPRSLHAAPHTHPQSQPKTEPPTPNRVNMEKPHPKPYEPKNPPKISARGKNSPSSSEGSTVSVCNCGSCGWYDPPHPPAGVQQSLQLSAN